MKNLPLEPREFDAVQSASAEDILELRHTTLNPKFAKMCDDFSAAIAFGDEIIEFCTSKHSWDIGEGRAGYRLMRSGFVQLELLVRMS